MIFLEELGMLRGQIAVVLKDFVSLSVSSLYYSPCVRQRVNLTGVPPPKRRRNGERESRGVMEYGGHRPNRIRLGRQERNSFACFGWFVVLFMVESECVR